MSKKNRAFTKDDTILIEESNGDPSQALKDQMKKINGLPDNCFTSLPYDQEVTIPISGRFLSVLRQQMSYLLECEETYNVLKALARIKENFIDSTTKLPFKSNQISLFEQALWANMTMISAISAAADQQKKSTVYDKDEFFNSVDRTMKENQTQDNIKPLDETELAARMGMTVDNNGNLHIDKDFLKKQSAYQYNGATEVDIALNRYKETSESLIEDPSKMDPLSYSKPNELRKEVIRAKMNNSDD